VAKSVFNAPHFQNEYAAFQYVESKLWPDGPICPHCGEMGRIGRLNGKTTRPGLCKCYSCKKPFTVRQGTILEASHLPLHLWLQAVHLLCTSKKGMSSRQFQRMLNCSMKTAWFLTHRIREAMRSDGLAPMGGAGSVVEVDETFYGNKEGFEVKSGNAHKNVILTLVERGGEARSFHVDSTKKVDVMPIIKANIARESSIMTDEAVQYIKLGDDFERHASVDHSREEWGYTDRVSGEFISTNTVEGFFGVFKMGMFGVYQHCDERHLHRYVAEFDFRYSNRIKLGVDDTERATRALLGVKGKRLTYETTKGM
jgi:transposase-like protein